LNKITKTQIIKHEIKCEIKRDLTEFHNFFLKKKETIRVHLSVKEYTYVPGNFCVKKMSMRKRRDS
jgi:hypothetical protein